MTRISLKAHRRWGKDLTMLNMLIKEMLRVIGNYYYIFPNKVDGRKILWNGKDTKTGVPYLDHFPPEIVKGKPNNTEMSLNTVNGSMFQVLGSDFSHSQDNVGTGPKGIIFSEYSKCDPLAWDYFSPALLESGGWALFNYTVRGRNHAWKQQERIKELQKKGKGKRWFLVDHTILDTGVMTPEQVEREIEEGMSENLARQEYYNDPDAATPGAKFQEQFVKLSNTTQISEVPFDDKYMVYTFCDLGMHDHMPFWFVQFMPAGKIHLIDFYINSGQGIPHYAKLLKDYSDQKGYVYGMHTAPWDIENRELGTGVSRMESAQNLGLNFNVIAKGSVEDRIEAIRSCLSRCWFDNPKCSHGVDALKGYRSEEDLKNQTLKEKIVKDWTCHPTDAFGLIPQAEQQCRQHQDTVGFQGAISIHGASSIESIRPKNSGGGYGWMGH